jgi:hypothetical protein
MENATKAEAPIKPVAQAAKDYMEKIRQDPNKAPSTLPPTALHSAEYARIVYVAYASLGTNFEDLSNPAYWAHHAAKLKPWDRIEVRAEDGTWFGEVLVLDASTTWAKVFPLHYHSLTRGNRTARQEKSDAIGSIMDDYEIKFRGPRRWSIIHKATKELAQEDIATREDAEKWLQEFATSNRAAT